MKQRDPCTCQGLSQAGWNPRLWVARVAWGRKSLWRVITNPGQRGRHKSRQLSYAARKISLAHSPVPCALHFVECKKLIAMLGEAASRTGPFLHERRVKPWARARCGVRTPLASTWPSKPSVPLHGCSKYRHHYSCLCGEVSCKKGLL